MTRPPTQPGDYVPPLFAQASPVEVARAVGEVAANRCAEAAEKRGWDKDGAMAFVLDLIKKQGPCSGEFCVNQAKAAGFQPHDDRAYGSVFQALVRKGVIRCVGYGIRSKGHATGGARTWAAVPEAEAAA